MKKKSNDEYDNLVNLMKLNYSYPDPDDKDFQSQIYKKREYYNNKLQSRSAIVDYQDVKSYRDKECGDEKFQLQSQQSLLSNFLNPDTPFTGLLAFHGTGTGKTCSAFAIAENFKDQIKKHNTKIYILVSGPLIKEQWKNELVEKCAKETYLKDYTQNMGYFDEVERNKAIKQAKYLASQFYKIMSYRSFQKKVSGQKQIEYKQSSDNTKKKIKSYKKNADGELVRDIPIDKIDTLDDTLLIIDEAHNLTDNEYGEAVKKIIRNSKNLRVLLLTATPMKNLGDDLIELINYLRPEDDQIEKDKVFSGTGYTMEFREGGREYLKKMINGYVSHFRGANPLIFAEGVEEGEVPPGLIFTKVIRCFMSDFQKEAYRKVLHVAEDTLDRKSQSVANFIFPGLNEEKTGLEGYSGEEGINQIRNQLKTNKMQLLEMVNNKFIKGSKDNIHELLIDNDKRKSIGGSIFKIENLKQFSVKFHECLKNVNDLVIGKKGPGSVFIYSNLVKMGIELFKEVLMQNGYLEFSENNNYSMQDDTIDSMTGIPYKDFDDKMNFHPATFMTFTGKTEETQDEIPETKMLMLKNFFNSANNKEGKYVKIVLGSRVMNEGITLANIKEVHLLDVYYNFGRVHQVIGRAIRRCVHYKITNEQNPYPKVNIYKYAVSLSENELSAEEDLYRKAEFKYILVKDIERLIKEASFDCPLNYHGNIFPEEMEKYKNCITPNEYVNLSAIQKEKAIICPSACDFQKCTYKCFDDKLNREFYDEKEHTYKKISKNDLDYTTFTSNLKRNEVNYVKDKIKDLFKYKYVYTLNEMNDKIVSSYTGEKAELFDEYFLHQALHELIPTSENDFNNFQDAIYDKYNVPGYLIYRSKYYIFQPFDQNEDVPMWYRSTYQAEMSNDLTVFNFIKNTDKYSESSTDENEESDNTIQKYSKKNTYDFSNMEYYNSKEEFLYIGIIDKGSSRLKSIVEDTDDIFKLRPKREKILEKKRGTGIPSLKGAVCNTSKDKNLLIKIAEKIGIKEIGKYLEDTRLSICQLIRHRLLFLEKFNTFKDNNKYVYMIIPLNHPSYPFPLNLEDRIEYIVEQLQSKISISISHKIENIKNGIFEGVRDKNLAKYKVTLTNDASDLEEYKEHLIGAGFTKIKNVWELIVE